MTLREYLDGRRPMKWVSFGIGLPLALFMILYPAHKDWPAIAGIVVPFALVIGIEYILRVFEWAYCRMRNFLLGNRF